MLPQPTQGRSAFGLGLLLLPYPHPRGREGLGLAGLQLRGAQGGENQRQPCGPRFHLPASKRCKQTLSPCQAAAAPSARPLPAPHLPLFPPPSCFFPESQRRLISGHPRGARTPGHAGGKREG